jgi:DNA-binding transcriptional LysR family regulator
MEKAMEYILLVNEEQSFSKAARKLFITQPALSAIVKKEEKKYGVKFFYRGVKPIILTEAGAKYIHAAKKVKAIDDSLYKTIKTNSSHHVNTITIGSSAYFCSNVLPSIISAFKKITPCNVQTY